MRVALVSLFRPSNIHLGFLRIRSPPTLACTSRAYTTPSSPQPHVRYITIDNPRKRNALSLPVLESLERQLLGVNPGWPYFGRDWDIPWEGDGKAVERFWEPLNRDVKVVILRSEGESVFSSGHDLKEISTQDSELHAQIFDTCNRVMMLIRELPQPIIAQVQGVATAAGCQLVAACDLAVASENATFATPGVNIGLFCTTPSIPLSLNLPLKPLHRLLLTGTPIPAPEALSLHLVSHISPNETLAADTLSLAQRMSRASGRVLALGKYAVRTHARMTDERERYEFGGKVMRWNLKFGDAREGIGAFLEKRGPVFRD